MRAGLSADDRPAGLDLQPLLLEPALLTDCLGSAAAQAIRRRLQLWKSGFVCLPLGKFVKFFGPALASLPLADRGTIADMAPEYGATCGIVRSTTSVQPPAVEAEKQGSP